MYILAIPLPLIGTKNLALSSSLGGIPYGGTSPIPNCSVNKIDCKPTFDDFYQESPTMIPFNSKLHTVLDQLINVEPIAAQACV